MSKSKNLPKSFSPGFLEELRRFLETHDPANLSRNLRTMLLEYLATELKVGIPLYLDELLWQLQDLFDVLDLAQEETRGWHNPQNK